jgi:hypothetical protein
VTIEARRLLGDTGLALYGTTQASALFGRSKVQASSSLIETGVDMGLPVSQSCSDSASTGPRFCVMPVLELEVGAEYTHNWNGLTSFVRAGLVGQVWFGAGTATTDGGNLGFLGLSLLAGAIF